MKDWKVLSRVIPNEISLEFFGVGVYGHFMILAEILEAKICNSGLKF